MLIFGSYVYCQLHLEAKCLEILSVHLEFAFVFWTSLLDIREKGSLHLTRRTNKYGTLNYKAQHFVKFQCVIPTYRLKLWGFFLYEMQFKIWMLYSWPHITQIVIFIFFVGRVTIQYLLLLQCCWNNCPSWYVKNMYLSKPLVTKCKDSR